LGFVAPAAGIAALRGVVSAAAKSAAIDGAIGQFVSQSSLTAARGFSRAFPLVGLALTAYELYELYTMWGEEVPGVPAAFDATGWNVNCGSVGAAFAAVGSNCGAATAFTADKIGKISRTSIGSGFYVEAVDFGPGIDFYPGSTTIYTFYQGGKIRTVTGLFTRTVNLGVGAQTGPVPAPMTEEVPFVPARFAPPEIPFTYPSIDPMVLPINKPVFDPGPLPFKDLPYRHPNPFRSPTEQTQRGPRPRTRPSDPRIPAVQVDSDGTVTRLPPADHVFKPPGKKSKERKIRISTGGTLLRRAFDGITELRDAVDAFWWALPSSDRTKVKQVPKSKRYYGVKYQTPTLQQKMADLYKHWNDVDMNKAVDNLVQNEIGDRAAAKVGKASGQAAAATGRPVGYQLGPVF
jgi:hypothetical protein